MLHEKAAITRPQKKKIVTMLTLQGESILATTAAGNYGEAFLVPSDSLLTPELESVSSSLLQVGENKFFVARNCMVWSTPLVCEVLQTRLDTQCTLKPCAVSCLARSKSTWCVILVMRNET